MRTFQRKFFAFLHPKKLCFLFFGLLLIVLCACNKPVQYFDYVSELRSNIFLAETDGFSLRIYAVAKENPYLSDGAPRETSTRCEVYFLAPSYEKECILTFTVNGEKFGGEMSFDNVKSEYYYACTLDVSEQKQIDCNITYGEQELSLCAQSVLTQDTLSPEKALNGLCEAEKDFFTGMTDEYGFAGEIYVRLLYEDAPYYYVGVIGRDGKTTAFLLNGKTGKILAKRES